MDEGEWNRRLARETFSFIYVVNLSAECMVRNCYAAKRMIFDGEANEGSLV